MIETPQSILAADGTSALRALVAAGRGRVTGAHFGAYDYTALCGITASWQHMRHPACDFAKHMMQVALAQSRHPPVRQRHEHMPIPPHRAAADRRLTETEERENRAVVHRAWKLHFDDVSHSLVGGFYQGWDLHPAQLPTRYAALYAFFLSARAAATARLRNFVEKAAQATLVGDVFDDAATGQGLLNFFVRGLSSGALTLEEARETGLSAEELHGQIVPANCRESACRFTTARKVSYRRRMLGRQRARYRSQRSSSLPPRAFCRAASTAPSAPSSRWAGRQSSWSGRAGPISRTSTATRTSTT